MENLIHVLCVHLKTRISDLESKRNHKAEGLCWWYAFNMIRPRIGKSHIPELANERKIEKIFSTYSTNVGKINQYINTLHQYVQPFSKGLLNAEQQSNASFLWHILHVRQYPDSPCLRIRSFKNMARC